MEGKYNNSLRRMTVPAGFNPSTNEGILNLKRDLKLRQRYVHGCVKPLRKRLFQWVVVFNGIFQKVLLFF